MLRVFADFRTQMTRWAAPVATRSRLRRMFSRSKIRKRMSKKRTLKTPAVSGQIPREDLRHVVTGVHVLNTSGRWQVRQAGRKRVSKSFTTKNEAVTFAKELSHSRKAHVIVHGKDGRISRADVYGNRIASPQKR